MTHLNYKRQYLHRETREVLESSYYLKKGEKVSGCVQYLVGGKWVSKTYVPEYRELDKKRTSTSRTFLLKIKTNIKTKGRLSLSKGRFLIGDNEFQDKKGCCDKLQAHYDEQVEKYGPICPITHMEFTFKRNNEEVGVGNADRLITNLSHDRLLNEHHYTKQNLLFTSMGWNLNRGAFSIKDMSILMREDYFKNYTQILLERFPDKKYEVEQLTELRYGAEHPQWGR
tara:strand:+ start:51 stop:731 length:681 start_codon:yes stop_codon:yes gene_type:complete